MSKSEDNVHAGHRNRLRKRFLEEGLDAFKPHEILELLLFYAIPRKDTNELAHKLLNHFHNSLPAVLEASYEDLLFYKVSSSHAERVLYIAHKKKTYISPAVEEFIRVSQQIYVL